MVALEVLTAVGRPTGSWDAKLLSALFAELVVIDTQNKPYLGPHALKPDVTIARSGTARHQLCGVDVVNCGEFKWGERKNALLTGENLGQCIQQGDTVLQCQPVRPYLFTYLADESGVVFLKFIGGKLDSAKFHFRSLLFSGVVPWTEAIPWLLATIVGDCQSYTMPRLSAGYYFTRYLGRGASGVVYEVKGPAGAGDGTGVVAKVFTVGTPTAEREVLAELGRAGVPNTPRLHEAEVGLDPCASHLLLTPLCVNAPDVVFTANHALEILSALQGAHDLGYVHRDVRPANIMFHDDSAHLIDWSFAVKTSELTAPVSFAGTTRCAHGDLLRAAFGASGGAYRYLPKPSDDFHAWVRACYLLAFPRLDKFLRRIAGSEAHPDVANLINFWNNVFGCSPLWAELRDAASVCDVGNLARLIMGLLPHKELVGLGAGE